MTTIGDLTLNDIGNTIVRIERDGAVVQGVVTNIEPEVVIERLVGNGGGTTHRAVTCVQATVTLGSIALHDLDRTHPCEVIE